MTPIAATLGPYPRPGDLPQPDLPGPGEDVPGDLPSPDLPSPGQDVPGDLPAPDLPAAARRALAEAEARRMAAAPAFPREVGGRNGPEPVRYGDWELKGLAVDFS